MTNAKKIVNKVMIALLAVVMVVASLGFAASMLEADDNSGISMNSDGIQTVSSGVETYASCDKCSGLETSVLLGSATGKGSACHPFQENDLYGRSDIRTGIHSNNFIEINVDTRNGWGYDDIIIEFKYTCKVNGKYIATQVQRFYATIEYMENGIVKDRDSVEKTNEAIGGFTKSTGEDNLDQIRVVVAVKKDDSVTRYVHFNFGKITQ